MLRSLDESGATAGLLWSGVDNPSTLEGRPC